MRVSSIADPSAVVLNGLLQIRKTEIVTGRRPQIQPLPNTYHVNPQTAPTSIVTSGGVIHNVLPSTSGNTNMNSPA